MSKYTKCVQCNNLFKLGQLVEIEVEDPKEYTNAETGKSFHFYKAQTICVQCKYDVDNRK